MRVAHFIIAIIALLAVLAGPAAAQAPAPARHALLIGNQAYTGEIGALTNPHNDVALLEAALKKLGFTVTVVRDARLGATNIAINRYLRTLSGAGPGAVGFFYYSGHGAADGTTNYLIPVDATSTDTAELWDQSLRLGEITRRLKAEAGNATHFVVFDACRNTLKLREPGKRTIVQAKGFRAERQEAGMLISYATAEGELASDIGQGAGPYAKALAEEIMTPGIEAVTMFRNVQRRVRSSVGQERYLGFNALGDVYFAGKEAVPAAVAPTAPAPVSAAQASRAEVAAFCREIATNPSAAIVASLRDAYKGTPMAGCADARLAELVSSQTAAISSPAPVPRPTPASRDAALSVGETFRDCYSNDPVENRKCPEMVMVPAGSFMMGSPDNEKERESEEGPQRRVTIAKPFAVGKFEVTFDEWDACVAAGVAAGGCAHKPETSWGRGRQPVISVSWDDAKQYVAWLARTTGQPYRLLSETEWEYAARAGTTTPYSWGDAFDATKANNDKGRTVPVGAYKPNAFGLHDMHGNVWEWVEDCWNGDYKSAPGDSAARTSGDCSRHVLRGGSWYSGPLVLRSAVRDWHRSDYRLNVNGFRVARVLSR